MQKQKVYTVQDVAEMLNLNKMTIRRYIRDGVLRATKLGGTDVKSKRHWRIRQVDLDIFLERSS